MALRIIKTDDGEGPDERKTELVEHLAELRARLIRSIVYAAVGMGIGYFYSRAIYLAIAHPILQTILYQGHGELMVTNFADLFLIKLQIAAVGGLVLAAPAILLELWAFIAPALTATERRAVDLIAPFSVLLFALGVACAYFVMPMAVRWFLSYQADFPGVNVNQNPLPFIVFSIKMLLIFGLLFELPLILMFFGKIGLLTSEIMIKYWRHISVGLFTAAMVLAPSNDPGTMLALAIPLTLLFFGSIGLVKMVEPKPPAA